MRLKSRIAVCFSVLVVSFISFSTSEAAWVEHKLCNAGTFYLPDAWIIDRKENVTSSITPDADKRRMLYVEESLSAHVEDIQFGLDLISIWAKDKKAKSPTLEELELVPEMLNKNLSFFLDGKTSLLQKHVWKKNDKSIPVLTYEFFNNDGIVMSMKYAITLNQNKVIALRLAYLPKHEAVAATLTDEILSRWKTTVPDNKEKGLFSKIFFFIWKQVWHRDSFGMLTIFIIVACLLAIGALWGWAKSLFRRL